MNKSVSKKSGLKSNLTYGIIVTYKPNISDLISNLKAVRPQVDYLHVIDNSEDHLTKNAIELNKIDVDNISEFRRNMGLAYALNYGVLKARENGYNYILLLDQDSTPQENMVQALQSELQANTSLAAAGPLHAANIEQKSLSYFICQHREHNYKKIYFPKINNPSYDVSFLISSGCLIDVEKFYKIGNFKNEFFIDHIDTEWCFRALSSGFKLKGISTTFMSHKIGLYRIKLWLGSVKIISIHEPIRNYYTFRNSILMYKLNHVPLRWIFKDLKRLLSLMLINTTLANNRLLRLKYMIKGVAEGLSNKDPQASG